eukprot:UN24986
MGMENVRKKFTQKCGLKTVSLIRVPAVKAGEETPKLDLKELHSYFKKWGKQDKTLVLKKVDAPVLVDSYMKLAGLELSREARLRAILELGFWRGFS